MALKTGLTTSRQAGFTGSENDRMKTHPRLLSVQAQGALPRLMRPARRARPRLLHAVLPALTLLVALLAIALLMLAPRSAHSAPRKDKRVDKIWVHPDYASFRVDRIAMLPVASFDNSLASEKLVESQVGQSFHGTGYRWISGTSVRDQLRYQTGSDSVSRALKAKLLENPRLDSLAAGPLCARLRCSAVLAFRIDLWEQRLIEWDQAGKPASSVQLSAALVDSSGRLLWSASGSQVTEGQYNDPNTGFSASKDGGIQRGSAARPEPPTYGEVLATLFTRWAQAFPAKNAPAAP